MTRWGPDAIPAGDTLGHVPLVREVSDGNHLPDVILGDGRLPDQGNNEIVDKLIVLMLESDHHTGYPRVITLESFEAVASHEILQPEGVSAVPDTLARTEGRNVLRHRPRLQEVVLQTTRMLVIFRTSRHRTRRLGQPLRVDRPMSDVMLAQPVVELHDKRIHPRLVDGSIP